MKDASALFRANLREHLATAQEDISYPETAQVLGVEYVDKERERLSAGWDRISSLAESPIESLLASALIFQTFGYGYIYVGVPDNDFGAWVDSQVKVGAVDTVDFAVILRASGRQTVFGIECDGHDFHDRTKEQAQRDRARDRRLAALGVYVLRFTGSEIYQSPWTCAEEISHIICEHLDFIFEGRPLRGLP